MTKRNRAPRVRVAIVDTGLDPNHPALAPVSYGLRLERGSCGTVLESGDFSDRHGHGTACGGLIRELAPDVDLIGIAIGGESGSAPSSALLARGIDRAIDLGADVIAVSAGVDGCANSELFESVCGRAAQLSIAIVATETESGGVPYPAAVETTLRVGPGGTSKQGCTPDHEISRRFVAYSGVQRVAWTDPRYIVSRGVSFATARMAALVARQVAASGRLPLHALCAALRRGQAEVRRAPAREGREWGSLHWIGKAAIFPFNKEAESLVRFRNLLPFDLAGIADPIARRVVGKDAGTAMGIAPIGLKVQANVSDALEGCDTLILGFSGTLSRLQTRDVRAEQIGRALSLGKNVYSFEPLDTERGAELVALAARRGLRVEWPRATREDLVALREATGSASGATVPVLGVVGTSSSQGKFTLQALLRGALERGGYRVGQIGTEHQAALLGMEECFPTGHVRNVELPVDLWPEYFARRYWQMEQQGADLLTFGTQGGVLSDEGPAKVVQAGLIVAGAADAFVVVVNHEDDHRRIRDTIESLQVFFGGRTILLAVSDQRRCVRRSLGRLWVAFEKVTPAQQRDAVSRLEDRFELPVVSILDSATPDRLLEVLTSAFASRAG